MGSPIISVRPCPICKVAMQASRSDEPSLGDCAFTCNYCGTMVFIAPGKSEREKGETGKAS